MLWDSKFAVFAGIIPLEGIVAATGNGKPFWNVAGAPLGKNSISETISKIVVLVVGANRIVICVGVIGKRREAGAEAGADHGLLAQTVRQTDARRQIVVAGFHAQVRRIAAYACDDQRVVRCIVV